MRLLKNTELNNSSRQYHHDNKSVICIPPYTPLLYSKTGVYKGMHFSFFFALKYRLWVLVRTASLRHILSKTMKNITIFHIQIAIFTVVTKSQYIAWARFRTDVPPIHWSIHSSPLHQFTHSPIHPSHLSIPLSILRVYTFFHSAVL